MEFLNEKHKERFLHMRDTSGKTEKNKEYELLYYIVAGNSGLYEKRFKIFSKEFDEFIADLSPDTKRCVVGDFTNSETKLLNLGVNMFNIRLAKMALAEIMYDLDHEDQILAFNLIKFKYNM